MKGIPTIRVKQLKRTVLLVGAGTTVVGASLLGSTSPAESQMPTIWPPEQMGLAEA